MSWISRSIVRTFKRRIVPIVFLCAVVPALPAPADASLTALYQQQTLRFTHVSNSGGALAVGINDPGFKTLLRDAGAIVTWRPGDRYVLLTTPVPVVVSFAIGDRRYDVGPISLQASMAPYVQGDEVYLPFAEVLRSLQLALRQDGNVAILQPQLASLDVRSSGDRVELVAHGGAPLHPRIVQQGAGSVVYEFDGVGTPLAGTRSVNAGGVRTLQIAQSGTLRQPRTTVTVQLLPGAVAEGPRSNDDRDVVLAFSGSPGAGASQGLQSPPVQENAVTGSPQSAPGPNSPANGSAAVTGVTVTPADDGYTVGIAVSGNARFQWHRLRDPDNRFWIDIAGAQLQGPAIDRTEPDPVGGLRVRQVDASTVRVALSLRGPKSLTVSPSATGIAVDVGRSDAGDIARAGSGSVGSTVSSAEQAAPITPAPIDQPDVSANDAGSGWKFGPHASAGSYVPTNPRLIVIDPGHGGSDRGSSRHGVYEADLALDMAKRLRDILTAQGWQVRMTRDTDVDVYAPNDSAHDELQARVDVANNAGARMFISIHANAYINAGPAGTTCYISKASDVGLAQLLEHQLASDGTKDDGIVKSHLYVTLHTRMPAVLVETAFISNPNDFALLTSTAWRQRVAQSIANGIDQYDQQYPLHGQAAQ